MEFPETPPAPPEPKPYRLEFTGSAPEYFRIWIVNLALSIATLGIYSAWAKVRKKRYLYAHTRLDGDPFEYRGNPLAILKGRLVAVVVVAIFYASTRFAPILLWFVIPAAIFMFPWLVVRSYAFNAHNSAWRNIRLRFTGRYWPCWRLVIGYGLLTIVTFGLGYFYFKTRLTEFVVRHHAFGNTQFTVENLKKPFFKAYGRMIGMGIVLTFVYGALVTGLVLQFGWRPRPNSPVTYAVNAVYYVVYLGMFAYIRSRILNAMWEGTTLAWNRFECALKAWPLFKLYLGNVVAIIATLGLATPWAVVRTFRYRAESFAVAAPQGLDGFTSAAGADVAAAGEEVGEMLDIDFSL